jgi:uncharacterized protein
MPPRVRPRASRRGPGGLESSLDVVDHGHRRTLGSSFVAGVALYTGTRTSTYDDRLHAMPIDRIWTTT